MPISIANLILLILTTNWNDNKPNGPALYNDDEFLEHLGIIRPSAIPGSPVPPGMSRERSKLLAEHIDAAIGVPESERLKYIEGKPGQTTNFNAVHNWKEYYRQTLGPFINNRLDNFLKTEAIHPFILIQDNLTDEWPSITAMERTVEIGYELFGPSVMKGEKQLHRRIEPHVRAVISSAYARIKKSGERAAKRLKKFWPKLEPLLIKGDSSDDYDMDNYCQVVAFMNRRNVSHDVHLFPSSYRIFAKWNSMMRGILGAKDYDIADERMTTAAYTAEDDAANKALGAKLLPKLRYKGKKCDLADPATVAAAFETLATYLSESVDSDPLDSMDDLVDLPDNKDLADLILQRDMGVDKYRGHSNDNLNVLLGRDGDRDQLFNNYTCKETKVHPWGGEYEDHKMFETGESPFPNIKLRPLIFQWHQNVGLSSIVELLWRKLGENALRVLLADDVGLGKTLQVLMIIAFIIKVHRCETAGKRRPLIVDNEEHRYFNGSESIPNLPFLIVVPNALESQWISEIHSFYKNGTVDVFPLPTNPQHVEFFFTNPLGEWQKSKRPMIERVVIATHSVLANLTTKNFNTARRMPTTSPESPRDVLTHSKVKAFWGIKWCFTAVDEAHEARVPTSKLFQGVCEVLRQSETGCLMSATPLHTGPRDFLTGGRKLGVSELCGPAGRVLELDANAAIRRARVADIKAEADYKAENEKRVNDGLPPLPKPTGPSLQVKAKYEFVKTVQRHMGERIIRRTVNSLQNDGTSISTLSGKEITNYYIQQSDSEYARYLDAIQNGLPGDNSSDAGMEDGSTVEANRNFYINARKAIAAPFIPGETDFPVFTTEAEFDAYDGCKLQHLVKLVKHILADDRAELPTPNADGTMVYPELPAIEEGEERPQTKYCLIYSLFSCTIKSIISALKAKGVIPYAIHGGLTVKNRDEIVEQWKANMDPARRVLIFTSVGATGCNLDKACYVIHYDQNWSSITDTQIDGRAWRMGQTEIVRIVHLIVNKTTDILMNRMANEKSTLLSGAVQRQTLEILQSVTKAAQAEDQEIDAEALGLVTAAAPRKAKAAPKAKGKRNAADKGKGKGKGKEKAVEESEEEGEEERERREIEEEEKLRRQEEDRQEKEAARKEKKRLADKARREKKKHEQLEKERQDAAKQGGSSAAATKKKGKAKAKSSEEVESEEEEDQDPSPAEKSAGGLDEEVDSGAPKATQASENPMDVDKESGSSISRGSEKPAGGETERHAEQPPQGSEKPVGTDAPEERATSLQVTAPADLGMDIDKDQDAPVPQASLAPETTQHDDQQGAEQQAQASEKPESAKTKDAGTNASATQASQTPITVEESQQGDTPSSMSVPAETPMNMDADLSKDLEKEDASSMDVDPHTPVDTSMPIDPPPVASASSSTQEPTRSLTEEKEVTSLLQLEKTSTTQSQESQHPQKQVPRAEDEDEDDPTPNLNLFGDSPVSSLTDLPPDDGFWDVEDEDDGPRRKHGSRIPSTPPQSPSVASNVVNPDEEQNERPQKRTADSPSPSASPSHKEKRRRKKKRTVPKPQTSAPYVNSNLNKRLSMLGDGEFNSGLTQGSSGRGGRARQPGASSSPHNDAGAGLSRRLRRGNTSQPPR